MKPCINYLSTSAPGSSKRHRARDSSLASVIPSRTSQWLSNVELLDGMFWDYFRYISYVDSLHNCRCSCKMCRKSAGSLNHERAENPLLNLPVKGAAICSRITNEQRPVLTKGNIITSQAQVEIMFWLHVDAGCRQQERNLMVWLWSCIHCDTKPLRVLSSLTSARMICCMCMQTDVLSNSCLSLSTPSVGLAGIYQSSYCKE